MSGKPQLKVSDVERGLRSAGFKPLPQSATSHIKWVRQTKNTRYSVTVDANNEPFGHQMVSYMAAQAGMSVKQFYELCSKDGSKKANRGALSWLANIFD